METNSFLLKNSGLWDLLPSADLFKNDKDETEETLKKVLVKLKDEQSKRYAEKTEDENLLYTLYREYQKNSKEAGGLAADIKKTTNDLQKYAEKMEGELLNYLSSGWGSGKTVEDMFNDLFNPFLEALDPLTNVMQMMGLTQIPVINTLPQMIQKVTALGRIVARMPPEFFNAAKAQADEAKKAKEEEQEKKWNEIRANKTWIEACYEYEGDDSVIGKLIRTIKDAFSAFLDFCQMVISNVELFAILMIIDKFKPVIDQFKIAVGDAVTILDNCYTLAKLMIQGKFAMIEFLGKMLWEKLKNVWYVLVYFYNGREVQTDALISGCIMDLVSANCDISAYQLSIDFNETLIERRHLLKNLKKLEEEKEKLEGLKSNKEQDSLVNAEQIKEIDNAIDVLNKKIDECNLSALPKNGHEFNTLEKEMYSFTNNIGAYYAQELALRTSQDEYLNPEAPE